MERDVQMRVVDAGLSQLLQQSVAAVVPVILRVTDVDAGDRCG
jgi:hypothetical protein